MNETIRELPNKDFEVVKDKCSFCGKETEYTKDTHIDQRVGYVEGAGQLCKECDNNLT